jgi:hypothetical protein
MEELTAVATVQNHFGLRLVRSSPAEYYSPDGCPWCGGKSGKSDRFRLFLNGHSAGPRVWCRKCGKVAFVDALNGVGKLSAEDLAHIQKEAAEALAAERQTQKEAIARMNACTDHLRYHKNVIPDGQGADYWFEAGMTLDTIRRFYLGYCPSCPTATYSPSYTLPYTYKGVLYDIKHRLERPNGHGKYRRHAPNLPHMLFNADALDAGTDDIIIAEGEKKTIVLADILGRTVIGTPGASSFMKSWVSRFDRFKRIYVLFDPDALDRSAEVASWFGGRGYVTTLPMKADDFFIQARASVADFDDYMAMARPA